MTTVMTDSAARAAREAGEALQKPRWPRRVAGHQQEVNVGTMERLVSGIAGGTMALSGAWLLMQRRSVLSGLALAVVGGVLAYRGTTGHCSAYKAAGVSPRDATATSHPLTRFIHAKQNVTINRSAEDLYQQWRDLKNLPNILRHVSTVRQLNDEWSHWVVHVAGGRVYEWDARLVEDRPNEVIAWASRPDAEIPNSGEVRFKPATGGRGTIVQATLRYHPPGGALGALLSKTLGQSADAQLHDDLRCFKQVMEAGEVATSSGQPRGRCA